MDKRFTFSETPDGVMVIDNETNNSCHIHEEFLNDFQEVETQSIVCTVFRNVLGSLWLSSLDNVAMTIRKAR